VSIGTSFSNYDFIKQSRLVTFVCTNVVFEPSILDSSKSTIKTLLLWPKAKLCLCFPKATKVYLWRRPVENVIELMPSVEEFFVWDLCGDDVVQSIEKLLQLKVDGHRQLKSLLWWKYYGFQRQDLPLLRQRGIKFEGRNNVLKVIATSVGVQWQKVEFNEEEYNAHLWNYYELDQFFH